VDSFTYRASDGELESGVATVTITVSPVNDGPVALDDAGLYRVLEDGLLEVEVPGLLQGVVDVDGDPLSIILVGETTYGALHVNSSGSFVYQPEPDYFGDDEFQFQVSDGLARSRVLSARIQVEPVNDPPSFVQGAGQFHQVDAPQQVLPGWASAISPGPSNESNQSLVFQVATDNPVLFSEAPHINPDGELQYTPTPGEYGVAVVTVVLRDNGGTANGGIDASAPQVFTVTVNSPPLVSIVSPSDQATFLVSANFSVAADAFDPDGTITRLDLFQSTNLLATFTNAEPYFTVLTNLAPGVYEFSAYAEDDRGASGWASPISVTVVDSPPVTATSPVVFNPQTGLFEQQVSVYNPSYFSLTGVMVLVDDLPPNASLFNANGAIDGVGYVLSRSPIPAGGSIEMTLEYYVPTSDYPDPTLSAQLDVSPQTVLQLEGVQQPVDRGVMLTDRTFMLEFSTQPDRAYVVEYTSDLNHWKGATPVLVGDGAKRQWIDSGQPKTDSFPGDAPQRFYRLILLP
jgi:hypothetical protein